MSAFVVALVSSRFDCLYELAMECAGVLIHDGNGNVLLGRHQSGGWTTFSGKGENGESDKDTAFRECNEESLFVFTSEHMWKKIITCDNVFRSKTPTGKVFSLFIIETESSADTISLFKERVTSDNEIQEIRWFSWDCISSIPLRQGFCRDLKNLCKFEVLKLNHDNALNIIRTNSLKFKTSKVRNGRHFRRTKTLAE
jgi:8-oxo-dGTP pyrophosphatase MutT (NUDIX family)